MIAPFRKEGGCLMPRTSVVLQSSAFVTHVPWYPKELLSEFQITLAAMADIDARYDVEREQLEARIQAEPVRTQSIADLEARCRAEREPCVQYLAKLHQQMMAAMVFQDICESA
jgi:hypothetical protein